MLWKRCIVIADARDRYFVQLGRLREVWPNNMRLPADGSNGVWYWQTLRTISWFYHGPTCIAPSLERREGIVKATALPCHSCRLLSE